MPFDAAVLDAAMQDAAPEMDASRANPPSFDWDSAFTLPEGGATFCALHVAAECDGAEDCGDGVCCATFDPISLSYSAITCEASTSCTSPNSFHLCHAGETCAADRSLECHRSLLIAQEFIGVCVPKGQPEPPPVGRGEVGVIACGSESCVVDVEQCCLSSSFDFSTLQSMPLAPRCAPLGTPCDCDGGPASDAGEPLIHEPDEDAGN